MTPSKALTYLRWLLPAGMIALVIVLLLADQTASKQSPIAFENSPAGMPAEQLALPGLTFFASPPGSMQIERPGMFITLKGNLLMGRGDVPAGLSIHLAQPHTRYSFRFATSAPSTLKVEGSLDGALVFTHRFSGTIPSGGAYPEGVALGYNGSFDALMISVEGGDAAFSIDDVGWPADPIDDEANGPVAIFCQVGGIEVYRVADDGAGQLAIHIEDRELDAVPALPAENTVVASDGDLLLSRLSTGEYQVNAGPDATGAMYVFIWDACPPVHAYDKSFNLATGPF